MRLAGLLALVATAGWAATITTGSQNVAVSVAESGALTITYRPTGRVFRTVAPPLPPVVAIRQATTRPVVDGDASDWAAVPPLAITSRMTGDLRSISGEADCSAEVRALWDTEFLYLAINVRDEQVVWPVQPDLRWWEFDSPELWLGSRQIGLSVTPGAALASLVSAPAEGVEVAMRPLDHAGRPERGELRYCFTPVAMTPGAAATSHGYCVEAAVPWRLVPNAAPRLGAQVPFAVGVNDADASGRREGQIYFPQSWVHSQPDSFAAAFLTDPGGLMPGGLPRRAAPRVAGLRRLANGIAFRQTIGTQSLTPVQAELKVTTAKNADAVEITLDLPDRQAPFSTLGFPAPLDAELPRGMVCFAPYTEGLAVPQDMEKFAGRTVGPAHDLPFMGVYDAERGDGYLLVLETPHDAQLKLQPVVGKDGKRRLAPQAVWLPQKKVFGQARRLRLEFVPSGGYVAIAKRYRAIARRDGYLNTLAEKQKLRPNVARLGGAPDVWAGDLAWAREAHRRGMEHCLLNYTSTRANMEEVNNLGWLTSRYDNYADLLEEKDPALWTNSKGSLDDVIVTADGGLGKGWLTWDKKTQYYERSSTTAVAAAKRYIPKDLESHPYLARFLDVTTASTLYEDYHPTRGQNRVEDVANRKALAEYVGGLGLVLGGEHGRAWAVPEFDYFEGMMSGNPFFSWPAGHLRKPENEQGEVSIEGIKADYRTFGIGPAYRVPLWELVFHDCVVSYWYWGDSTDFLHSLDPSITDRKDALNVLYGTPPMYWADQRGFGRSTEAGWQRLMQSYRDTCRWHQEVFDRELLDHQTSPDKVVQRTTFAGGYEAVANLGEQPREVTLGETKLLLPPNGFAARGPDFWLERRVSDGRTVSRIRSPRYAFVDGAGQPASVTGLTTAGRCTVLVESPERIRVVAEEQPATLQVASLVKGWDSAHTRVFVLDTQGRRSAMLPLAETPTTAAARLIVPAGQTLQLVTGAETRAAELSVGALDLGAVAQGQPLRITARLRNDGTIPARANVVVRIDGQVAASQAVTVPAGGSGEPILTIDTRALDGPRRVELAAELPAGERDLLPHNNRTGALHDFAMDRGRWPAAPLRTLTARNGTVAQRDAVATVAFALPAEVAPDSLRVYDPVARKALPAQFEPATPGGREGLLVVRLSGELAPNAERRLEVLAQAGKSTVLAPAGSYWLAGEQRLETPFYGLNLGSGMVTDIEWRPNPKPGPAISFVSYSNAVTGWTTETGRTEALEVLAAGPVRTVLRLKRNLAEGKAIFTRTYAFYADWFEVTTDARPSLTGLHNRFHYVREATYVDSAAKTTRIDGKGDDDDKISGAPPAWVAVIGDGWAHSMIPLEKPTGLTYWDGGSWGGLGYSGTAERSRQAFVFHGSCPDASFAAADAARLQNPVRLE